MTGPSPTLLLKRIAIDTYHENVAYLHRDCPTYKAEGFQALSKIEIQEDGHKILAVLNVVDDQAIVKPGELGLSEQAFVNMGLAENSAVKVNHAEPPHSMEFVRAKLSGERINQEQFHSIVKDIASNRYSKPEIAAFLVAVSEAGLDRDEVLYLTHAMVDSGQCLDWEEKRVVDKHCIGGIPGNRTSMLVVPIVAAFGLLCPKTSSRAITSPSGTADTMEVLAQVDLPMDRLHKIVREQRGCLAWGGTAKLAPADDVLISVERPLAIDSQAQMVASILSKKRACGSTHLLIDIPAGPSAKVRSMKEAMQLRKLFEYVGDRIGLVTQIIITDGRQPIGQGIGPVLEAQDVMKVLRNHPDAPHDLREKSLQLAGRMIEFDNDIRGGEGYDIARDILDSGRALYKMEQIIESQGKNPLPAELGKLVHDIPAPKSGCVIAIDNLILARVARLAGAPMDKGAGVFLLKKLGETVQQGEPLYRIYSEFPSDFEFACHFAKQRNGIEIGHYEDQQTTW
ncbi:MAG: thymidine phosphorylase family protein [Pseudomonadales bacterium]|nr:thymidine phosphorylase family protein [Pseudomonadales bacterium]